MDANGNGKYDLDALGESTFAKSFGMAGVPEEATVAVVCGSVIPAGGVDTGGEAPTAPNAALLGAGIVLVAGGATLALARQAF